MLNMARIRLQGSHHLSLVWKDLASKKAYEMVTDLFIMSIFAFSVFYETHLITALDDFRLCLAQATRLPPGIATLPVRQYVLVAKM